jgi:[ribosomal protein S5]-alanine N-acetyltransferase
MPGAALALPTLASDALLLRPIALDDAVTLASWHCDPQAMALVGSDVLTTLAQVQAMIASFEAARTWPNPGWHFGVALPHAPSTLIGTCGIFHYQETTYCARVAYDIAPAYRDRGLGKNALTLSLNWAFATLELERVEAHVHPENIASLRLLAALGFVRESLQKAAGFWRGRFHDMVWLGLERRDWRGETHFHSRKLPQGAALG